MFERREVAVLVCGMCSPLSIYAAQPILPVLAQGFGVQPGGAGLTVAAPTIALALAAPFIGSLSDRFGRKPMILAALALIAVPTLLAAQAASLGELLVWQFAQGVLTPAISAVALAYIGDEFAPERASRLTAFFISANVAGGFLGRYVSAVAADHAGWRASFAAIAILQALGCVAVAATLPPSRRFVRSESMRTALGDLVRHASNPILLATFAVGFCVLFCIVGAYAYLGFRLSASPYDLSLTTIGSLYGLYGLSLLVNPMAGRIIARLGPRIAYGGAALIAALALLVTIAVSLPLVIAGLTIFIVAAFAGQSAATNHVLRAATGARSAASGLYMSSYYLGGAAGSVLPGLVWQRAGWTPTAILFAAVMALSAVVSWRYWTRPDQTARRSAGV